MVGEEFSSAQIRINSTMFWHPSCSASFAHLSSASKSFDSRSLVR